MVPVTGWQATTYESFSAIALFWWVPWSVPPPVIGGLLVLRSLVLVRGSPGRALTSGTRPSVSG